MGKPTGFLEFERKNKVELDAKVRIGDFKDFHLPFDEKTQKEQASRCMNCGIPFCQSAMKVNNRNVGCPLSNLIPEWNHLIYLGLYEEAYKRLAKTAPFPEFTGNVCPALCEACCSCSINGDAVGVKANELFLIEKAFENGWIKPKTDIVRNGKKVAIIGSGPSGLACARELNYAGFTCTVYEKNDRFGGLLMYGIPNMKIEKQVIERRINLLKEEGIEFIANTYVGKDIKIEDLKSKYDEIVFACGTSQARKLMLNKADLKGVIYAVDFLSQTTKDLLDGKEFTYDLKGKNVIVLGGGDTGNDCLGTATRLGAKSIKSLEIMAEPPKENTLPWPNFPNKKKTDYGAVEAIAYMGHEIREYQVTVDELIGKESLSEVVIKNVATGEKRKEKCDVLLICMGFVGTKDEDLTYYQMKGEKNRISLNGFTYERGISVCGDMKNGQSLVVLAIKDGIDCAKEIIRKY